MPATPQNRDSRRYRSFPDRAEIDAFIAQGHRFWDKVAYENLIGRFLPGWQMSEADMPQALCSG